MVKLWKHHFTLDRVLVIHTILTSGQSYTKTLASAVGLQRERQRETETERKGRKEREKERREGGKEEKEKGIRYGEKRDVYVLEPDYCGVYTTH